ISAAAQLDESALTGESRVVARAHGDVVRSGVVNAGPPFELLAIAGAAESAYAGIVRLVREAQSSKAPFVRLADRYAAIFVPVALAVAGVAWAISGSPVRALAVLVVATPCPLLLAAPIAIVSGISRAARRGVIIKDGGALETLARAEALYFDKTGTLTVGSPVLTDVIVVPPWSDAGALLGFAAAVDQLSSHVLAAAIVRGARARGIAIPLPDETREVPGGGIEGVVAGRDVVVGSAGWVTTRVIAPPGFDAIRRRLRRLPGTIVVVAIDGSIAGAIVLDDPPRPDAARTARSLKRLGFTELVMLTGDHPLVAESVGLALGIDRVLADRSPEEKVDAVRASSAQRVTVMVGDGINDAPALAAADVGVAMGARGATSSSEAADVVLVADRLDRLVDAIEIARRARTVAVQSVWLGMGLSAVAMAFAAAGLLAPVAGALLQEAIDAVAILSALRALRGGVRRARRPAIDGALASHLREEHAGLMPRIERLRAVADGLDEMDPAAAAGPLRGLSVELHEHLLPHERADEHELYPRLAARLPGDDPLAAMSRSHREIFHLARVFDDLLAEAGSDGVPPDLMPDLRRVLYGLHAVLRLHFAHEEELYHSLTGGDEAESHMVTAR
ncbi:MAG: heavy metal translocating P-type ATPase, partial [Chloroflexi bacterium]|nr:heavy metal translocating P-type ATPase [Chloroflexota bacterium]